MKTKLSVLCEKIIEAGWLTVVVAPLFFNAYSRGVFETDKTVFVRIIASVMALAWVVWAIERNAVSTDSSATPGWWQGLLKTPLFAPVVLLATAFIISAIFSISPRVSFWGSYARLQGIYSSLSYMVVFALVAAFLRTRAQADRLVAAIILTSIPIGLYAVAQHFRLDFMPFATDTSNRVISSLGNAIALAGYLIMVVPLTLSRLGTAVLRIAQGTAGRRNQLILAILYALILVIQLGAILFSQSRGPVLALTGAVFVMGLIASLMFRQQRRWLWVGWLSLSAASLGLIIILNVNGTALDRYLDPIRNQPYLSRFSEISALDSGTASVRVLMWDAGLKLAANQAPLGIPGDALAGEDNLHFLRMLIGYGPETIPDVFPSVHPAELYYHHAQKNQANLVLQRDFG